MSENLNSLSRVLADKALLMVDDDPETILDFRRVLRDQGISVRLLTTLSSAWEQLGDPETRQEVGLVLIDLQMVGQVLPRALADEFNALGTGQTVNNQGQALGYSIWNRRFSRTRASTREIDSTWPRYAYMSMNPLFWCPAQDLGTQEWVDTVHRDSLVLNKFRARTSRAFCETIYPAWLVWDAIDAGKTS